MSRILANYIDMKHDEPYWEALIELHGSSEGELSPRDLPQTEGQRMANTKGEDESAKRWPFAPFL